MMLIVVIIVIITIIVSSSSSSSSSRVTIIIHINLKITPAQEHWLRVMLDWGLTPSTAASTDVVLRAMETMLAETILADLIRAAGVCWCKRTGCATKKIQRVS